MPDRAVVIGANGYLGRHLARELANRGSEVVQSGRTAEPVQAIGTYVAVDLSDRAAIGEVVDGADEIYFAAGATGTAASFDRYEEFVATNEIGLFHVLHALREQRSQARVVFPSTRLVYRGQSGPLTEDSPIDLKTPYAINKFAGEQLLRSYGECFGIRWVVFRVCVVYGEEVGGRRPSHGTVASYLDVARAGQDLMVFGDGSQRRTLTHIADVVNMMIDGAHDDRTNAQVLNIGGPEALSVRQVADAIAEAYGVSVREVPWPEIAARIESGSTVFDASKLEGLLGRGYRFGFHEWLDDHAIPRA